MIQHQLAEIKVSYTPHQFVSKIQITHSQDAHKVLRELWDKEMIAYKEQFYVLLLNNANSILGYNHLATGGSCGVIADVKQIIQLALTTNAQGLLLAHNHPSGNKKASRQDIELTNKVKQACVFHEIQLLDHLILMPTGDEYVSMADEGLL